MLIRLSAPAAPRFPLPLRIAALAVALGCLLTPPADAQSDASLRQSGASLMASVEVPAAVLGALIEGGKFVVSGVVASGGAVAITLSAVTAGASLVGASFVVYLTAEAARGLAIGAGTAVEAVAVSGGWLLMAAGEALCFVANEATRGHVRSRELTA